MDLVDGKFVTWIARPCDSEMNLSHTQLVDTHSLRRSFPETHWSVVLLAGDVSNKQAEKALEELCRSYWLPLYVFARKLGHSPSEAEDLTQSFFAELLTTNLVGKANVAKGR